MSSCDISCFTDDTCIYKSISSSTDANLLQLDLLAVSKWSKENNMKLHSDKFVFVNFNTRHVNSSLANLPFYKDDLFYTTSDSTILETSDSVTVLLTWVLLFLKILAGPLPGNISSIVKLAGF